MLIQTQVGPIASIASIPANIQPPLRSGNMGDLIYSALHGRYYETTYRRAMYVATSNNSVGTNTTVGTATTYNGLCVSNPIGSTVNLVLTKVGFSFANVWPAAASIGLMTGYNGGSAVVHTSPVTPKSLFTGLGASGQGLADYACTLPTAPTVTHLFAAGLTGTLAVVPELNAEIVDLEGSVILPPGAYAAIYTSTASSNYSLFGSFAWEEVPV